ncbi:hypothetical protein OHB26_23400 [Nocardia sp. NBC_01503]|uniref:WXG100-like domain-containing protein n=1 Tax=Nocardia sp. NBC_01503 TaxID=2975997 RepID=UPI002E7C505B|nr:hypothetical protein [Nocardia sp. NBC_01503]WTL29904.1 hypothetical protein OHB26_23400 [Nocardia sp. NBC_01503]
MAIEIPHEVALFLNYAGVPYPDINEDQVRELATHVRNFAAKVRGTHEAATGAIKDMNGVWSGYSYEQLITVWARMSATHMAELDRACKVVAVALNAAAELIVVTKVAVLAELTAMASTYLAAIAGTFATGGLSAVVAQSLPAMASKLLSVMEQVLIAYLLAEVLGKAIEPLGHVIERMVGGALHNAVVDVLDLPPPPSSSAAPPMRIEPDEVMRYADLLDAYADQMLSHAEDFANKVGGLDFTTDSGRNLGDSGGEPARNPPADEFTAAPTGPPPPVSHPVDPPMTTGSLPAQWKSLPAGPPIAATDGPDRVAPGSDSPSDRVSPRRGANSAAPMASTGSAANGSGPATNSAGPGANSAAPRVSAPPWQENSGMRRESPASEAVRGGSERSDRAADAPRTSDRTETHTAAVSSGSERVSEPAATAAPPSRERTVLAAGPTAEVTAPSGGDGESAARQPDPMGTVGPTNAQQSASPWRGGPVRRRGPERVARTSRERHPTAAPDSQTSERSGVPVPERGVASTPWSKRVRESDTVAKVFAPQTESRVGRARASDPVREDAAARKNPTADPANTVSDSKSRRSEEADR